MNFMPKTFKEEYECPMSFTGFLKLLFFIVIELHKALHKHKKTNATSTGQLKTYVALKPEVNLENVKAWKLL